LELSHNDITYFIHRGKTLKEINGNSLSVKSIISIIKPRIIEKSYLHISMLPSPNPINLMFFCIALAKQN
jgi:hypothetical protein